MGADAAELTAKRREAKLLARQQKQTQSETGSMELRTC